MLRYVIAIAISLIAVPGLAQWTPADIPGAVIWLPTDYNQRMWQGAVGSSDPVVANSEIRNIETLVGSLTASVGNDANRPFFRVDGARFGCVEFGSITSNRFMSIGTAATPESFHRLGSGYVFGYFKRNAVTGTNQVLIDCRNNTNALRGFTINLNTSNQLRLAVSADALILDLSGASTLVNDTNWHYFEAIVAVGTNASSIAVDGGTPVTGTLGTTVNVNPCSTALRFGARSANSDVPFSGLLDNPFVATSVPSVDDRARLIAFNPPVGGPASPSNENLDAKLGIGLGIGIAH